MDPRSSQFGPQPVNRLFWEAVNSGDPHAIMTYIDSLPKRWRALVHEYGFMPVTQTIMEGYTLAEAKQWLVNYRAERQLAHNRGR